MADDPIAGLAVQLNEESKAKRRGRKPAEAPAAETAAETAAQPEPTPDSAVELNRMTFTLSDEQSTQIRTAITLDETAEPAVHLESAWQQIAAELAFDPDSIVITAMPDDGPIAFNAMPLDAAPAAPVDGDGNEIEGVDAEAQQSAGLRQMEESATDMILAPETLVGDLTTGLLEMVKGMQKPWPAHSQIEKRELIAKIEIIAKLVARQTVDVVAADERITVKAIVEKIAIGDKTMITLKLGAMPEDEMAEAIQNLFHCQKKPVLIVTADADRYMGKRRELLPPDQEDLPFEAGRDPAPVQISDEELFAKGREIVLRSRNASVSYLQRELRTGYNSAARIVERMEKAGELSAPDGSGKREVIAPVPDDGDLNGGTAEASIVDRVHGEAGDDDEESDDDETDNDD